MATRSLPDDHVSMATRSLLGNHVSMATRSLPNNHVSMATRSYPGNHVSMVTMSSPDHHVSMATMLLPDHHVSMVASLDQWHVYFILHYITFIGKYCNIKQLRLLLGDWVCYCKPLWNIFKYLNINKTSYRIEIAFLPWNMWNMYNQLSSIHEYYQSCVLTINPWIYQWIYHEINILWFLSPAMAKPLGGHRNAMHPCVRPSVRPSVTKLVSAITSDFVLRFTPNLTQWCIPP